MPDPQAGIQVASYIAAGGGIVVVAYVFVRGVLRILHASAAQDGEVRDLER